MLAHIDREHRITGSADDLEPKRLRCPEGCGPTKGWLKNRVRFANHLETRHRWCIPCGRAIGSLKGLKDHVNTSHRLPSISCPFTECSSTFTDVELLVKHVSQEHRNEEGSLNQHFAPDWTHCFVCTPRRDLGTRTAAEWHFRMLHRWPRKNDPYSGSPAGTEMSSEKGKQAEALSQQSSSPVLVEDGSLRAALQSASTVSLAANVASAYKPVHEDTAETEPSARDPTLPSWTGMDDVLLDPSYAINPNLSHRTETEDYLPDQLTSYQSSTGQETLPSNVKTAVGSQLLDSQSLDPQLLNDTFDLPHAQSNRGCSPIAQNASLNAANMSFDWDAWAGVDATPKQSQVIPAVAGDGQGYSSKSWAGNNGSTVFRAEIDGTSFLQDMYQGFGGVVEPALAYGTYDSTANTTTHPDNYPPRADLGQYPNAPQMPQYPTLASSTTLPSDSALNVWLDATNDHADYDDSGSFYAPHMQQYPSTSFSTRLPMDGTANCRPHASGGHPSYYSPGNNIGSSYAPQNQQQPTLPYSHLLPESGGMQQYDSLNYDFQRTYPGS
ncbi:MAG: hypothetical protein Q9194_003008 [Teloschistes cf. exilis]